MIPISATIQIFWWVIKSVMIKIQMFIRPGRVQYYSNTKHSKHPVLIGTWSWNGNLTENSYKIIFWPKTCEETKRKITARERWFCCATGPILARLETEQLKKKLEEGQNSFADSQGRWHRFCARQNSDTHLFWGFEDTQNQKRVILGENKNQLLMWFMDTTKVIARPGFLLGQISKVKKMFVPIS